MSELLVTKDTNTGEYRWILVSSSAYLDRDDEIVTSKALEQAVARMKETGKYGDLRWWHTGIKLGDADRAAVYAHQLVEGGTFVSQEVAEKVKESAGKLGASIGFRHPPDQPRNKQYEDIAIVERSILPRGKESNLFTRLSVTGGGKTVEAKTVKETLAEKRDELVAMFGEHGEEVVATLEATAKEADGQGVVRKEKKDKSLWQQFKEALGATPDPEETEDEGKNDDTDELETVVVGAESEKKEAKAAKADDDDTDDAPLTMGKARAMITAAITAAKADWDKARTKETDTLATLATKEEVAQVAAAVTPVVTIQQETVTRLGVVEKQVQTLTGENLPRGMAGFFRASVEGSAATEKAAEQAETLKARQKRDPLDVYLDERLGA